MRKKLLLLVLLVLWALPALAQNPDSIPFAPAVNYGVGSWPYSIFSADLDGDSYMDLVVVNVTSNNVSILKNNRDGTFQTSVNYAVAVYPYSVFCADLDGDGDMDLAVANNSSNNVSILKNNGDGTFQTAVNYAADSGPTSVFSADLDRDTDPDLAVTNWSSFNVSILKNNGDGTFQTAANYAVGNLPASVFCADLDGDNDLDLAVANAGSNNISILKNNGDGTFQTAVNYASGALPMSVYSADLDWDGDLDLVVTNQGGDNVSILKNNGDGTFQAVVNYAAGSGPMSVYSADLDGDTDLDLAVANRAYYGGSYSVSILQNNGDATFQTVLKYAAGSGPASIFCADLDKDGDLDLAVANEYGGNVSILSNLSNLARPDSFSLISPLNADSARTPVSLKWQKSIDPDPKDTVRYDLYLSRSLIFAPESTVVCDSLLDTTYTDSLSPEIWYWKVKAYDKWGAVRWSDQTWSFYVYLCGDCNGDGLTTVADVVYAINYLFKGGPVLKPLLTGDTNCDGKVTVADVVYTINYLFKGGPRLCEPCQSLIAYYPFNGNANDESGNGNNGTVNGASPTNDRFGKPDSAYFFNMSDITIPASNSLNFSNSFTVSVWSNKIGTDPTRGSLVATGGSSCAKGFLVQHRENGVHLEVSDGDGWDCIVMINTNSNTENDEWHHFVFVVDRILDIANAYVDGDRVIINQDISGEPNISDPNIPLRIGKLNSTDDPQYFNGSIDDIRIYNRALTDNEIQALYKEGGWPQDEHGN